MEESILASIKKLLNISVDDKSFDQDVLIHINTVFMVLNQLGVGLDKVFSIKGSEEKWSDFLGESEDLESVKTYIYLKVKMVFDPPSSSSIIEAYNNLIKEFEWRLNSQVDFNN